MRMTALILALLTISLFQPAEAKHHRHNHPVIGTIHCDRFGCRGTIRAILHIERRHSDANGNAAVIGGRPAGCPHAYCGCGLRKYLGLSDVRLNLAWNWAKLFPRESAPRPGLAAVRHHHVMYIEAAVGNGEWLIRDYNSGRGLSRLHIRDVRGYVFVNPRG